MNDDLQGKNIDIKLPIEIEQYERKIYDLKQLIEISKGLNSTLDYNILIDSILLTCMGQMQLLKAGIFTKKEISHDLFVLHRNYKGFEIDHSMEYGIMVDSPLVRYLESANRCCEMSEILKLLGQDASIETLKVIDPSLIVPLKGKGRLNGIIILGERINASKFLESEKEFLLNIASLAGIAIQNAYLFELATTDMMTGLKIHHFFQNSLMEERERAHNNKTPLSLIMLDIDHFKNFNDSFGHLCGDQVLINVARLTMDSIRQLDLAARYGGEEFIILLPNTELNEARAVAERIRQSIESAKVECGREKLGVTVSLGVAQYDPERDDSNLNLIERADKAMYLSKEGGRNRISVLH